MSTNPDRPIRRALIAAGVITPVEAQTREQLERSFRAFGADTRPQAFRAADAIERRLEVAS